jgi:RNA polymerase sigma-70 factor (ECF subfamily)
MQAEIIPLKRRFAPAPAAMPTGELVVRARAGEVSAQQQLFDRHVQLVAGLVRRLIPDQPDLDDVVQDVFVRALESLPRQRDADAFAGWLRSITVHVVRNRLRRRRLLRRLGLVPRAEAPDDERLLTLVSPSAPPDVLVELRAVYRVVSRLEPNARTALILRRVEGLTVPEIAEELGCSLSTTKRWIAAAETQLDHELHRAGGPR